MKKKFLIPFIMLAFAPQIKAQEVYNQVLQSAEKVINNPKTDDISLKINQFKSTTLRFIKTSAVKQTTPVSTHVLDIQAYYLSEFLSAYFKSTTLNAKKSMPERKKEILRFVNATTDNPLFEVVDTEMADSYLDDTDNITPFSLNTDWQKAYNALTEKK